MPPTIDLEDLGFDRGAHIIVQRALRALAPDQKLTVRGTDPALGLHLQTWCRVNGHVVVEITGGAGEPTVATLARGKIESARWLGAERSGELRTSSIVDRPAATWGPAARGALIEAGGPDFGFDLDEKRQVWTELAPRLYAQAVASQWDPATAVDWSASNRLPDEIESAVVQVMTYLVENEQAALAVPARFLGRIHPHFREVVQFLAVQVADEARHVEVFTRRAGLHGNELGMSTVGGRASLATLIAEPDFSQASFLLSVLGEGTFLNLLAFLDRYAPDPATRDVTRLARIDETRHVAFAMGHLEYQIEVQPEVRERLRSSIERRHEALRLTSGLGDEVYDALVILAAGSLQPSAIAAGYDAVATLQADMAEGRERRLIRLGFPASEAAALSSLHTRNFM